MDSFHTLTGEANSRKHPGRRYTYTITVDSSGFVVRVDTGLATPSVTKAKAKLREFGLDTHVIAIIGKHYFIETHHYPYWRNIHTTITLAVEMADRLVAKLL